MNEKIVENVQLMRVPNEKEGRFLKKLKKIIEDKYRTKFDNYWEFHKWTVDHTVEFWTEIWDFVGIISSRKYDKVIDLNVPMSDRPEWFLGARLNYAENLLKYRDDAVALILTGEDREEKMITYSQMYEEARLYAAAFRKHGLKKGDVVACCMSNREEPIFAMLGAVSIGAIWTGALPLLGAQAVLHRLQRVNPKFLLTMGRFLYGGQEVEMLKKVKEVVDGLPTLAKVIITVTKGETRSLDISCIRNSCFLEDFLSLGRDVDGSVPPMEFEQVSMSHPVFINYTSGSTGLPKAIIHGCGALLSLPIFAVQFDLDQGSVSNGFSPAGWISWNVIITNLSMKHTILLYEGMPYFRSPTFFWDLVEKYKVTNVNLSTSVLEEMENRGIVPTEKHSLKSLKVLTVAGTVAKHRIYEFVHDMVSKDILFSSIHACTEIMGTYITPECTLPIYKGEIPAPSLGVDVEIVDESDTPVVGEYGEMVITKPLPGFPLGLWDDADGSLFREKYFTFSGKFKLGDCGIINPNTKGYIILCRSDETLKQRGCRFGCSEIYNIVEVFPEIRDCLCVSHYKKDMDEQAVLFLKMAEGFQFTPELVAKIRMAISRELTIRHVPDIILEVQDFPYSVNGKKMEMTVKKIINNMACNLDTVRNPDSLKHFYDIPELKDL